MSLYQHYLEHRILGSMAVEPHPQRPLTSQQGLIAIALNVEVAYEKGGGYTFAENTEQDG